MSSKRFGISVNTAGAEAFLEQKKRDINDALRPAAQAGAAVLCNAVKENVASMTKKSTGRLMDSIYQVHSKKRSRRHRQVYEVSWNKKTAPHGHLVEFGHLQPYEIRYNAKTKTFYTAVKPEMLEEYRRVTAGFSKPVLKGSRPGTYNKNRETADKYFLPRKGGPIQVPARPFVRRAVDKMPVALDAVRQTLLDRLSVA